MLARILRSLLLLAALIAGLVAAALGAWCDWSAPAAILGGVAAIISGHAAVLGWEFLFASSVARQRHEPLTIGSADVREMPAPPGWQGSPWLRAWLGEIVASLRTFFYAQVWFGDRDLPSARNPERIPVLLLHGYFCNRAAWRSLAARLAARGHPVASLNLEPVFGSIDDYAPPIAAAIERLRAATGAGRVALVGHSMGGLAARAALRLIGPATVAGLVTMGSPHRGTVCARRAIGRNAAQMEPESEWLRALAAGEPPEGYRAVTVIVSHQDNIVVPALPQSLPGARTVAFTGLGHVELIYSPSVHQAVCGALDEMTAEPSQP